MIVRDTTNRVRDTTNRVRDTTNREGNDQEGTVIPNKGR
jgi:hypothetical protein